MGDLANDSLVLYAKEEGRKSCVCAEDRERYYQAQLKILGAKKPKLISELLESGTLLDPAKAALVVQEKIEADARAKAEEVFRAKSDGTCYLFFEPSEKSLDHVVVGYEDVDEPLLSGAGILKAVQEIGQLTWDEVVRLKKGGGILSFAERSFRIHNTTPLERVLGWRPSKK